MPPNRYYAVARGHTVGVFESEYLISNFPIISREEYTRAVEGFTGSMSREFAKQGRAITFVQNNRLPRSDERVILYHSTTSSSSGSAVRNRNEVASNTGTVTRSNGDFIGGHRYFRESILIFRT
jgi:hypothetical protein